MSDLRAAVEALVSKAGGRCVVPDDVEDPVCLTHSELLFDGECEDQPRQLLAVLALIDAHQCYDDDAVAADAAPAEHIPSAVWTWDEPYVACSCGWEANVYDGSDVRSDVDWGHPNPVDWAGHLAPRLYDGRTDALCVRDIDEGAV